MRSTLALALAACAALATAAGIAATKPEPTSRVGALRATDADGAFTQALGLRAFEFPQDHGPHDDFRHEWWYVTGNLDGGDGERFGFELTFFRFAFAPEVEGRSRWRARQMYLAHFAVTDVERDRFHFAERYARDALGLAGAQAEPFRVWLDDWSIVELADGTVWRLRAGDGEYALSLELRALTAPVLNGENGLSRKAREPGAASYYYSIPRIDVQGTLHRGEVAHDVRGLAWLDREWGSGSLGREQQGWDWYALQFADGSAFMFYALRTARGRDALSAGTWIAADGTTRALGNEDVTIDVQRHWDSPRGGRYPARWRLRVPSLALDVDVTPVRADQELVTNVRYWEGAVDVRGSRAGADAIGRGYVELVGYDRSKFP